MTFLAGTEIDAQVIRKNLGASVGIGIASFLAPYLGVLAYAHGVIGWSWPQAQIAGISMSTTSVAVVYAVMVETGFNKTELGKIILAACFITDLGTVLATRHSCLLISMRGLRSLRGDGGCAGAAGAVGALVL